MTNSRPRTALGYIETLYARQGKTLRCVDIALTNGYSYSNGIYNEVRFTLGNCTEPWNLPKIEGLSTIASEVETVTVWKLGKLRSEETPTGIVNLRCLITSSQLLKDLNGRFNPLDLNDILKEKT